MLPLVFVFAHNIVEFIIYVIILRKKEGAESDISLRYLSQLCLGIFVVSTSYLGAIYALKWEREIIAFVVIVHAVLVFREKPANGRGPKPSIHSGRVIEEDGVHF